MSKVNLFLFPSMDVRRPRILSRTRLFSVEPIGIGTSRSESFTSYIARQAKAHSVSTGALFSYELAPRANKPYLLLSRKKGISVLTTTFFAATPSLNGLGASAKDWVNVLQHLNGRTDLRYLTMLTWTNVLTERFFSRPIRAWCCECLEERKVLGLEAYECLLWMLKIVKVCPFHKRPFETLCPTCGLTMRPLGDRSLPGYCSRCGTWLGSSNCQRAGKPAFVRADLEYEVWASNQIGELIAVAPTLLNEPTKEMIRDSLFAFIDYAAGGNRPGFAREFGLKKNTVQSWGSQRPVPQTDLVLKLCYQTGISLFDFLVSKTYLEDEHWLHRMKEIKTRAAAQIVRRNPEDVQKALMTALKEKPPRSIKEISEGLGYANTCTIERLFPSLCKKLRIRYRKLRVNRIQWRRTPIDDALLKEVLLRALNNELPPSIHRLTRDLGLRHSEALRKRFPDLCEKIIYRRMTIRQKGLDRIEAGLNAALTEVPPPSITKVANRLGYCNHATLSNNFPELCERVSQRYRVALRQRNDAIREELKSALAQSLPPTLREIGKKVSRDRSYFCVNFPTFARAITEKRRKQQRRLSISKTKAVTRQIRRVAKQLYSEGLYPSMRFVKARLAGQMTFDTKHLSDVLREVRRELGLPHHLKLSV